MNGVYFQTRGTRCKGHQLLSCLFYRARSQEGITMPSSCIDSLIVKGSSLISMAESNWGSKKGERLHQNIQIRRHRQWVFSPSRRNWAPYTLELRLSQHSCVGCLFWYSFPYLGHGVGDTDLEDRGKPCSCCWVGWSSPGFVEKIKKLSSTLTIAFQAARKPVWTIVINNI